MGPINPSNKQRRCQHCVMTKEIPGRAMMNSQHSELVMEILPLDFHPLTSPLGPCYNANSLVLKGNIYYVLHRKYLLCHFD